MQYQLFHDVATTKEKVQGVVVIDIGHHSTMAVVYIGGKPVHSYESPTGLNRVIGDVGEMFHICDTFAENAMEAMPIACPAAVRDEDKFTFDKLWRHSNSDKHLVYHFAEVIEARFEEIISRAIRHIDGFYPIKSLRAGGIIAGQAAKLRGIKEVADGCVSLSFRINQESMIDIVE